MNKIITVTLLLFILTPALPSQMKTSRMNRASTLYGHSNPGRPTPEPSSTLVLAILGATLAGMSLLAFKKKRR